MVILSDTGLESVQANGVRLACQLAGQGKPVLLLHGAFVSHALWKPTIPALAAAYRVIAPDFRGHGQSSRGEDAYSIALFADDMAALLDALQIDAAVVAGHSMGGMAAQQLAVRHPDRVRALVLAETNYGTRSTRLGDVFTSLNRALMRRLSVERVLRLTTAALGRSNPELQELLAGTIGAFRQDPNAFREIADSLFAYEGKAELAKIACPTLVLTGARNRMTQPQARVMAKTIPDARFACVADAGHALNWDNPGEFNRILLEFLAACYE